MTIEIIGNNDNNYITNYVFIVEEFTTVQPVLISTTTTPITTTTAMPTTTTIATPITRSTISLYQQGNFIIRAVQKKRKSTFFSPIIKMLYQRLRRIPDSNRNIKISSANYRAIDGRT